MQLHEALLAEFTHEAASTRKLLAVIPDDQFEFKPHPKSMSLVRLATHVAEIAGWWKECLVNDELDFSSGDYTPKKVSSTAELLAMHDDLVEKSTAIIANTPDDAYTKPWTMRNGSVVYFTMPKAQVVRTWCMNHLYHHRGQLTVYLRLLNVPLPGIYGPSADDQGM